MSAQRNESVASFRARLFTAIMIIVATLMALGLYLAQRKVAADAEQNLQQNFQAELSSLHRLEELRNTALAERCNKLAAKPRIHAAIEDDALDLLYPSAKDELRDLMEGEEPPPQRAAEWLHARFYRFLDSTGAVIKPPNTYEVGQLDTQTEAQLSLNELPETQQIGYIEENAGAGGGALDEVIASPIFSTETGDVISALVIGFTPLELGEKHTDVAMKSGVWVNGQLYLPSFPLSTQASLSEKIANAIGSSDREQDNFRINVDGASQLLFYKRLNPGSLFPPAYRIYVYPLAYSMAQLRRLRWQIGGAGALLLLGGFVASHLVARRFSAPVQKLALDSEENRAQRRRAEAALASTAQELERSSRYSADASHQLKSPVTVLRVCLEALLAREGFKPEVYEQLSVMLHQTHRLTGVIDDLLLLSRMDAGHLQIASTPVNLSQIVDEWLDDLSALPDSPDVKIEKEFAANLFVAGEKRYTSLIVQNLLENARKYNRSGGRIRVSAHGKASDVVLTIGNTGRTIPSDENIFERFHHRSTPSAVSGHGIGLNLARELARLHGGDLRLIRSGDDWTEFEVRFRAADSVNGAA
ncbi:MAG: HAMP domain-containing histidine kinase [Verrucomicrobia bacterium]|nr:HAMP domain-containing histidine kinase [Verrucomicrobiota bacterium]